MTHEIVQITQADKDLQDELWRMSMSWGNRKKMTEMIARHRMAERDKLAGEMAEAVALIAQYRDDMRRPPADDSTERRLRAISTFLSRHERTNDD